MCMRFKFQTDAFDFQLETKGKGDICVADEDKLESDDCSAINSELVNIMSDQKLLDAFNLLKTRCPKLMSDIMRKF